MSITIPGFEVTSAGVAEGITLTAAVGGQGPPIVLLLGFPQTHLIWRHVAPILAERPGRRRHANPGPGEAVISGR